MTFSAESQLYSQADQEQISSKLAHDLRSPLAAIRLCAQLALRRSNDSENVARQCEKIIAAADRLDQLIEERREPRA